MNAGPSQPPARPRQGVTPLTQEQMAAAFKHHQAGELAAAARLYQQILSREPEQPDALHLLGVAPPAGAIG